MAFNDLPKINRASIQSDQSVVALQCVLNQLFGFILRADVPDFGCDFDVELIGENKNATNSRFPLQLKSVESISFVQENKFISYSFKTSRLGYLLRRLPAYGIIVLYDVKTEILYYDYADEVYLRLLEERESEDWKVNEHVSILIPINNVLDKTSAEELHQKFTFRFDQGAMMQSSHGAKYGIPGINFQPKRGYDFNNLEDIKRALREKGMALLFHFDLQVVYALISQVPVAQIVTDKELCMIALIAYTEAGKYADSMYFVERIRKRFELAKEDMQAIDFVELKNQLGLGNLSPSEYIEKGNQMLPKLSGANLIILKINMLFFQLSKIRVLEVMPLHLGEDVQKLFFEIEAATGDELQKQYLKLWNGENMLLWIAHFRNEGFAEMQLREAMNSPLPLQNRIDKAKNLVKVHGMFYAFLSTIDKKAKEWKNDLLHAHLINLILKFEIGFQIGQITNNVEISEKPSDELSKKLEFGVSAFATFLKNNHFLNAYLSLIYQIELIYISRQRYHLTDKFDLDDLLKTKADMEREFEFEGEITVPRLLETRNRMNAENSNSMSFLVGLNDSQLNTLAEVVIQAKNFPNAKKEFIIDEMKSYQLFHDRCSDADIIVEQSPMSNRAAYTQPVSFILTNRRTNFVSLPNIDMDKLLKSFGY